MAAKMAMTFHQVSHCPICKEAMTKPRITECGHTFCQACLSTHLISKGDRSLDRKVKCPLCKKSLKIPKGGIEKFPINYVAVQARSAADEADRIPTNTHCAACQTRSADGVFCQDCKEYLCGLCGKKHQAVFNGHDVTENMANVPTAKCTDHPGKTVNFFCSHCAAAVCPLCATSSHSEAPHRVTPLVEAKNEVVELVKGKLLTLKDKKKKLSGAQDRVDRMRQSAVDNYALQKGMVESTANDAVRRIREEERNLQRRIQDLHDNNIKMLDQQDRSVEEKSTSLDTTLNQVEAVLNDINISDFQSRSLQVEQRLREIEDWSNAVDRDLAIHDYTFKGDGNCIGLGCITLPKHGSYTDIDLLKSGVYEEGEELVVEEELVEEVEVEEVEREEMEREEMVEVEQVQRRRRPEQPEPLPRPVMRDQTERKAYIVGTPMLVSSYVLGSGVDSSPITMVGVGLMPHDEVVCAYNTNIMGQVVMCSSVDKQQVVYHRRKGIAAFAMYREEECGVVLYDDCNASRLFLNPLPSDREATCRTHKISCKVANIGALAFHLDGVIVLFDKDKKCLTGIDRQSKRPFNLQGNRNEKDGCFSTVTALASGPQGEIILYDGEKRRLAIFSSDTKFLNYIDLGSLSSSCSIDCDDYGMLFIADRKQGRVVRCAISGQEDIVEVLNATHGITYPCCLCVSDTKLAVGNAKSFSEGEIRVFELGVFVSND
ncbi:E3 ubiquitin-protein ligase TRIM56-like [Haliotis rufescens]|uniref:E3 ubiquitin-protein ligase TRIM56-like n=1 Tax=Haliotis rufescens TaxID=6454 RepID=UPI00201EC52A|nr:E3 ubiquitin-protein ligase TRIM56-like [Haliotis rufescens]